MPQAGRRISTYFPNEDERAAMAVNCVHMNGASCDRMSDPSKCSFVMEDGKEWTLYPDGMGNQQHSRAFEAGGIQINSEKKLLLAGASIRMEAPKILV